MQLFGSMVYERKLETMLLRKCVHDLVPLICWPSDGLFADGCMLRDKWNSSW